MPYQNPPFICPVCQKKSKFKFIQDYQTQMEKWSLYECSECKVQFWLPFKNPGAQQYESVADYSDKIFLLRKEYCWLIFENYWYMTQFLKHLPHEKPEGKKLLDLGCGGGEFLWVMQTFGYEVYGVDFNENAINFTKHYLGIDKNIYKEDVINFLKTKKEEYDVITAFEIIEHLDDPKGFLELIHQSLKPNGFLALSTVNRKRFFGKIDPAEEGPWKHLTRWDANSLISLIKSYPFEIILVKKQIPIDWLSRKLWKVIGTFYSKLSRTRLNETGTNYLNGRYATMIQKRIGIKKYKFIKSFIKPLLFLPALFLFYVLKLEGSEIFVLAKKKY